jgi:ParB family transcriptional regulator, chromosome partitioning protein
MSTIGPPAPVYRPKLVAASKLRPHPHQIRDQLGDLGELAASIEALGLLEPLLIEPDPDRAGGYLILAGERRWRAAQQAGHSLVIAREMDRQGLRGAIKIMLGENGPREPINPMEYAHAFGALVADGMTQAQVATETGYSAAAVSRYLTLLELSEPTQERVRRGTVTVTAAIEAVRKSRKTRRHRHGRQDPGPGVIREPDYFTARHPLAGTARALCANAGHGGRRKYGRVACGPCWETVIRRNESAAPQTSVVAA